MDDRSLSVSDIDGSFVPRPINRVTTIELDGEMMLGLESEHGLRTFFLNRTGQIVWSCFDGQGTLDELIDDFSEAFHMPREVVAEDVMLLTRRLGAIGLLAGIKPTILD